MERHCVNSLSVKYVDTPLPDGNSEGKVLPEKQANAANKSLAVSVTTHWLPSPHPVLVAVAQAGKEALLKEKEKTRNEIYP